MLFLINLLTNPLLNMVLGLIGILCGKAAPLLLVLALEAAVTLSEGALLRRLLPERKKPFLLSLLFNGTSYLFGVLFFAILPIN